MNQIVVGMGEALWDCLPEGKKIGGAPANFAYHVSQFGFDSRVVSAVGIDADGDEILDVFAQKGLRTQIERVPYPTGTVQVTLDAVHSLGHLAQQLAHSLDDLALFGALINAKAIDQALQVCSFFLHREYLLSQNSIL